MPRLLLRWLMLALLLTGPALADPFPAPAPYADYANEGANFNVADYRARAVTNGWRVFWQDGAFADADGKLYTPPEWFRAGFPDVVIDGLVISDSLDDNAIGRVLRSGGVGADDGWRRLSFVALDLPDGDGGFDARNAQLLRIVTEANLPNLAIAVHATFTDSGALQAALDAMYKAGGDGYILQHKDADYDADDGDLLLALPYEIGDATVIAHRPGKGELAGMMGSMEVADANGGEFILPTGFTRAQRRDPPPLGAQVRFKYKGFTPTGKPKNPVFLQTLQSTPAEPKIAGVLRAAHLMWLFIVLMLLLTAMDAATHTAGGRRWNFKSAIVSTGLLGTFVGVFWGLYNFNTSDIAAGVPTLLEGLKLAFVTSITGIALSTMLSVVQTILGVGDKPN